MIEIHKILVPTDFSTNARAGVDFAIRLARAFDGELILVHVIEPPLYPAAEFGEGGIGWASFEEKVRSSAAARLAELTVEIEGAGVRTRSVVRTGKAVTELLQAAADESADLVVIATHGYAGLKHMLLGSTAERVVRHSPCPVLTVRSPDR